MLQFLLISAHGRIPCNLISNSLVTKRMLKCCLNISKCYYIILLNLHKGPLDLQDKTCYGSPNTIFINLTTFSKYAYVNGFLGSFQTPNPDWPPYSGMIICWSLAGSTWTPHNPFRVIRLPYRNDAKIAEICNLWTFWPVIQPISHLFKIGQKAFLPNAP